MRTDRHIILDQRQHILQHRHHAGLVALAVDDKHVACARQRHVAALQAERFGDAQARSVQQRHHRGIARPNPGIAGLSGALIGVRKTFGRRHMDRFRQALPDLWRADRRQRADLTLAFLFEEARERAQTGERPHQRTAADIVCAPHRHEGPDVGRLERCKTRKRHLRAPVLPEKAETLADVAGVGFQRLRRQPSFAPQMRQPARHLARDAFVGAVELDRLNRGSRFCHKLPLGAHQDSRRLYRTSFVYPSLTCKSGSARILAPTPPWP